MTPTTADKGELLPLPEPTQWFIDVTTNGRSTGRYEVCAEEYRDSEGVVPLFTAEQMREYALANMNHATAKPAETCNYPDCNCPFDAPADPSWCARGLQKQAAKPDDALGSLPVVAYIRYAHNDSQRFLSFDPSRNETHTPLTAHATATAEIAKKDAFWKRVIKIADAQTNQYIEKCKALEAENASLRAQLAEAQKDAGRLDWLEAQTEAHGFCHVGHGEYRHYAHQIKGYNTVRQALDAAMQSAQEKV